jgi:hypothetical protein
MSNEESWKERYEILREDFDLTLKENTSIWNDLYKVEKAVTVGEIIDILSSRDSIPTPKKINKPEGGYRWN